ncbi:hypothetical protein RUE5091_03084 [Ruegeria denitrificans]|uniref:Uncharacterized protein n=1 Tax=Ruegeria denitrificans TaxID=1715692 RepID=A0A0P1IMK4_9RHOB|nr:hypothetical protein RUE5091_03084 [Ruegeria denitrificans]
MSALLTFQEWTGIESQFLRNFMSASDLNGATNEKFNPVQEVSHGGV